MSSIQLRLEDDASPAFAEKVVGILNPAIATDSHESHAEAAAALNSLFIEDYTAQKTAGSFLWWFWDLIHDLARQIPYNRPEQDRLAAIINNLTKLLSKTVDLGENWGASSVQVWAKLPMFGNTFREKLDDDDTRVSDESSKKERRINLQAFAARVASFGHFPFEVYAIWALVDALEGTMTPIRGAPDEVNSDPTAVEDISYKVKCAAVWTIHAGHLLYGRDEEIPGATAGPLWKLDKKEAMKLRRKFRGTDGLCSERWKLWKERFGVVRNDDRLDDETRGIAGEAYRVMEKTEDQSNNK
ncbi:hypothetical protein CkaCkLH20_11420 [Colletotrichum karsti]|uniref:Uncharacterized protein n=1 Tax=Colletotrichum karsti TaxID=1095194 RepID=A0A9P6LF08_9PEZI|nr:uncharacterized protein CkaCkLH20_11420 [Colletotrichum karsti]KAF9871003.1 hypothetical protein CkaCkLH20_11420 [Colletotrichum karsti]